MKTVKMINNKVLILFLIAILIALSMPMSVSADDEGDQPKDERYIYSLKDFWENYDSEDIGYHVVDPMEKIYLMESEEPLEIQVVREEDDGLLLEHFLGLTLTWVYSDTDPTIINYVEAATPDYEVTEEEGVLTFIFSKDSLKSMENDQRYEFLFTFDDGQAYSLVWASDGSLNLVYTESGHVFLEPPEIVDPYPLPATAFADEEDPIGFALDENISDEDNVGSLEGFYSHYNPEDIGYHVAAPKEKIHIVGTSESLNIQVAKEENNGSIMDHFTGVEVNRVYTSLEDVTTLFYEKADTPDYEVKEENGILTFTFDNDCLKIINSVSTYEIIINFDDGKAYSLVWVTKEPDLLGYTESGHVWIVSEPPEVPIGPDPKVGPNGERDMEPLEELDIPAPNNETVQAITEENTENTESNVPKTGDSTNLSWLFIMAAGITGLTALSAGNRKR